MVFRGGGAGHRRSAARQTTFGARRTGVRGRIYCQLLQAGNVGIGGWHQVCLVVYPINPNRRFEVCIVCHTSLTALQRKLELIESFVLVAEREPELIGTVLQILPWYGNITVI